MATSDNENENESTEEKKGTKEDRLEEIKKEEKEDASTYYAQGKGENPDMKEEFEKEVPEVEKAKEDMNLLRAVAFLGFGLAALAVIFILFFIRDLDQRVGGVDSAVNKLEDSLEPLKTEIEGNVQSVKDIQESLNTVTATVAGLQGKLGDYEKSMAIMELKRALVMVQGISMGSATGVQSKSTEVAASIQSLLSELGGGAAPSEQPAGEIQVEEAAEEPAAPAEEVQAAAEPEEAPAEEPAAEESEMAAEEPAAEEETAEESDDGTEEASGESEEAESEEGAEESEEGAEDTEEAEAEESPGDDSEESEAAAEETGEADAEESPGDDHADEEQEGTDKSAGVEELPTVEELLQE